MIHLNFALVAGFIISEVQHFCGDGRLDGRTRGGVDRRSRNSILNHQFSRPTAAKDSVDPGSPAPREAEELAGLLRRDEVGILQLDPADESSLSKRHLQSVQTRFSSAH